MNPREGESKLKHASENWEIDWLRAIESADKGMTDFMKTREGIYAPIEDIDIKDNSIFPDEEVYNRAAGTLERFVQRSLRLEGEYQDKTNALRDDMEDFAESVGEMGIEFDDFIDLDDIQSVDDYANAVYNLGVFIDDYIEGINNAVLSQEQFEEGVKSSALAMAGSMAQSVGYFLVASDSINNILQELTLSLGDFINQLGNLMILKGNIIGGLGLKLLGGVVGGLSTRMNSPDTSTVASSTQFGGNLTTRVSGRDLEIIMSRASRAKAGLT